MNRATLVVLCAGGALLGGCLGRSAPPKGAGSDLWMTSDSGELAGADQTRLAALGVREMFLDAGDLVWSGTPEIRRRKLPRVPRRTPSTLVVYGTWQPGKRDPDEVEKRLLTELQALRIEAEQSGVLVAGFHFEIDPGERGEHFAKTLRELRSALAGAAYVSCGIDRRRLDRPESVAIASASDFVTSFLYGQRPGEPDDPTAWDLEEVERNFRLLESLRRPYLVGAITLGTASLRNRAGGARGQTTALSLGDLVGRRSFSLRPGFSLQGVDRQVWEFVAESPVQLGEWAVERGDTVRVVRTATPLVEEFRRRVGAWESSFRLGEIYFRLPKPAERLSLSARNLETVLGPESAAFELGLSLTRTMASRDVWVVTARLENLTAESSDLAYFDSNYVQIDVVGAIPSDAERGGFHRTELLHDGDRSSMQALRAANQVRLYLPYVDSGQIAESGPITLRLRQAAPQLRISASFLLPEGRMYATDPIDWTFEEP